MPKKQFIVNMTNVEVIQISNITNILLKYNWHLNFKNNKAVVDLKL